MLFIINIVANRYTNIFSKALLVSWAAYNIVLCVCVCVYSICIYICVCVCLLPIFIHCSLIITHSLISTADLSQRPSGIPLLIWAVTFPVLFLFHPSACHCWLLQFQLFPLQWDCQEWVTAFFLGRFRDPHVGMTRPWSPPRGELKRQCPTQRLRGWCLTQTPAWTRQTDSSLVALFQGFTASFVLWIKIPAGAALACLLTQLKDVKEACSIWFQSCLMRPTWGSVRCRRRQEAFELSVNIIQGCCVGLHQLSCSFPDGFCWDCDVSRFRSDLCSPHMQITPVFLLRFLRNCLATVWRGPRCSDSNNNARLHLLAALNDSDSGIVIIVVIMSPSAILHRH